MVQHTHRSLDGNGSIETLRDLTTIPLPPLVAMFPLFGA